MRKVFPIFFTLIFLFTSSAYPEANNNAHNPNAKTQTRTRVINSTNDRIQITTPSSWNTASDLNAKAILQAADPNNNMYLLVIDDDKSDYPGMTLAKHSEITRGTLLTQVTSEIVTGPESMTIGGNPAVQYEIRGEIKGLNVVYLHTSVMSNTHFYQIVSWTLQSEFSYRGKTMQDIISSFKETQAAHSVEGHR